MMMQWCCAVVLTLIEIVWLTNEHEGDASGFLKSIIGMSMHGNFCVLTLQQLRWIG